MTIKPIRSAKDYEDALTLATTLMTRTDQGSLDDIEVLQAVIERWEAKVFRFEAPTPVQAIRFRLYQLGLKPRDLAPYLGTKSRISEVMNGQRQLTVDQVRALNRHLGIPAQSLIGLSRHEPPVEHSATSKAAMEKLKSMGFLKGCETVGSLVQQALVAQPGMAMLRKSRTDRTNAKTDLAALEAWCAAVVLTAEDKMLPKSARPARSLDAARGIARFSREPNGPALVERELAQIGIVLVLLDHLPGTFLDGAALCRGDGAPVIALTLRHDRLDNFWFTLMHEFAHVSLHVCDTASVIVDDLDVKSSDAIEAEADEFAREALIPSRVWHSISSPTLTVGELNEVAAEAAVHPAIIAGRWRWEHQDYRRFSKLIGRGEVRRLLT